MNWLCTVSDLRRTILVYSHGHRGMGGAPALRLAGSGHRSEISSLLVALWLVGSGLNLCQFDP